MNNTAIKSLLLVTSLASLSGNAKVTTNIGYASEYYYRGVYQTESSASAGVDFEHGDFSGGLWSADVGDGLEYDIYASYSFSINDDFSTSLGFTNYYYSGEFDDTYKELNLGLSYKFIAVDYAKGSWDGGDANSDDYDYLAVTFSYRDLYAKYATFGDEFDGDYLEFGYSGTTESFDYSFALILSSDELSDQLDADGNPTESEALIFSLSKSFDL